MRALLLLLLVVPLLVCAHSPRSRVGIASWHEFGRVRVCASNFIPLGTIVRVEYGGRDVDVRVVSTGPHPRLGRTIDLSPDAFEVLAPLSKGLITVRVTPF